MLVSRGRLEPTAVLVGAFQVKVGREAQALVLAVLEHGGVRHAALPPHVEDVLLGHELRAAADPALRRARQVLGRLAHEPCVGALAVEQVDHRVERLLRRDGRAALRALEHGDGHAPRALARDAPVGTVGHHGADAVLGPGGDPFHAMLDGLERVLAQAVLVHGHEPLVGGAEDDRLVAAPAVRVAVRDLLFRHQRALLAQPVDDERVGLVGVQACEPSRLVGEAPVVVHRHEQRDVELEPHQIVVLAVPGSGVHAAGARVQRDVVAVDERALQVLADGTRVREPRELAALERDGLAVGAAHEAVVLPARDLGHLLHQVARHDHVRAVRHHHHVVGIGRERHGRVRRQRPGRRGPDEHVGVAGGARGLEQAGHDVQPELHEDGGRRLVAVLDLGLGQRRVAALAPVDGLAAAVHRAVQVHFLEYLDVARPRSSA